MARTPKTGQIRQQVLQWLKEYADFVDAFSNLNYFLDVEYNHTRIRSASGYLAPAEFGTEYENGRKLNR